VNALLRHNVKSLAQLVERAGPYLLLELLLPGGTLFALLLFLYRNRPIRARIDDAARTPVAVAQPMTLMSTGKYLRPAGAYLPSILS
jgi:hypothetical protein